MNQSICFLAQFPPPVHGLSKAVDTLYSSALSEKYHFPKIDITSNRNIFKTLWKLLFIKCDIVYFTIAQTVGGNLRDLLFLIVILLRRKKCIVHLHGGYYRHLIDNDCSFFQRKINYILFKKVDSAIVLGESLRWIFDGIVSENDIHIVKNCIDNCFCVSEIDEKLSDIESSYTINVLYLSNFISSKGYPDLLKVILELKRRGIVDKFKFYFAGKFFDEREKQFFDNYISENELSSHVIFNGPAYGQDKIDLLKKCHVFSLLSTYPNEGQPISILEAMGNGMAIITTNHAGIPDIATSKNGFVSDKSNIDVSNISDFLIEMYKDREALKSICKLNYDVIQSDFTEENYINAMDSVFEKYSK